MKNPLSFHAGRGKNAVGVLEPLPMPLPGFPEALSETLARNSIRADRF